MKKLSCLGIGILLLFWGAEVYSQNSLKFTQIINTPDQVIGAEILKTAYIRLNISIKFIPLSGKRALFESSQGNLDGEVHRIFKVAEDYPTLIRVPTPINYIEPTVFSKKERFTITQCSALKDYVVGIVGGVRHAELCTEGFQYVQILPSSNQLMKMLNRDRVDLVITAKVNGLLQLKRLDFNSIHPLSPALNRMLVYHYLYMDHYKLVPKIDQVFQAMKKSGELEEIRKKVLNDLLEKATNQ